MKKGKTGIGGGRQGKVYKFFCKKFQKWYAVKVIENKYDLKEVKTLVGLSHPNVIQYYHFVEEENEGFEVMTCQRHNIVYIYI